MSNFDIENEPAIQQLARQIRALQRETRALARAAQGPLRSVDVGTGGTTYYGEDGTPLLEVGVGPDGEFGLVNIDPTPPPVPEAPDVESAIAGINIKWDGTFVDANWTTNMSHVEVHVSTIPDFVADDTTQVTAFTSPNGGEFTYATPNDTFEKYVALVAVTVSGVESEKSVEAAGAGLVVNAEVSAAINELIAQVDNNTAELLDAATEFENLAVTTQTLFDQTASLDGRVSTSDYDPGLEDVPGRTDGSIWLARTRPRKNFATNPSFEVNTIDWAGTATTLARVAATPPVDGGFVLEVTNSGAVTPHRVTTTPAAGKVPCVEGQVWSASVYAKSISGGLNNYNCQIWWYDVTNTVLPGASGASQGAMTSLVTDEWTRLTVQGTVPAGAVFFTVVAYSDVTNTGAVWRVDAALIEKSPFIGSYFDGTTYDCMWTGTAENSSAEMVGGKVIKFYELDESAWFNTKFSGAVLADIDAATITTGYMDGERIQDNSVPIDKMSALPSTAAEALAAGDLTFTTNVGGVAFTWKADADNNRPCNGYVLEAVAASGVALVRNFGYVTGLAGLTVGERFLSDTAGASSTLPPTATGSISQSVGVAVSATVLQFQPTRPVWIT